ncbi:MAG: hypothetical protein IPN27_09900 [Cellvibrionales bacterium]|nr:hypothetical protein [Cellvibrionales bacterium]
MLAPLTPLLAQSPVRATAFLARAPRFDTGAYPALFFRQFLSNSLLLFLPGQTLLAVF